MNRILRTQKNKDPWLQNNRRIRRSHIADNALLWAATRAKSPATLKLYRIKGMCFTLLYTRLHREASVPKRCARFTQGNVQWADSTSVRLVWEATAGMRRWPECHPLAHEPRMGRRKRSNSLFSACSITFHADPHLGRKDGIYRVSRKQLVESVRHGDSTPAADLGRQVLWQEQRRPSSRRLNFLSEFVRK